MPQFVCSLRGPFGLPMKTEAFVNFQTQALYSANSSLLVKASPRADYLAPLCCKFIHSEPITASHFPRTAISLVLLHVPRTTGQEHLLRSHVAPTWPALSTIVSSPYVPDCHTLSLQSRKVDAVRCRPLAFVWHTSLQSGFSHLTPKRLVAQFGRPVVDWPVPKGAYEVVL